jgi:cytochrome P450
MVALAEASLIGRPPASPAGPAEPEELGSLPEPPQIDLPRALQVARFSFRQSQFLLGARRRLGEVFRMHGMIPGRPVITSHPDHARSLFTAKVEHVPSLTAESPLRPIVGPNSVLTANGPRHLRQRKLLLPPFHGEAIEQYRTMIAAVAGREIDAWPVGREIALAPRMQAITLDVIMAGIFGIEGRPAPGTPEDGLRVTVPWRLGEYAVPAGTPISVSTLLLHHRGDLYPEPFAFRPERWHGHRPGTYEWIPFGGGTRRCLGAALAMAEMRIVLDAMAARLELEAADPEPEHALHRNVTMIPRHGARVVVRARR